MAIIYSYPELLSLEDRDLLLISDLSSKKNPTRSVKLGNLAKHINMSTVLKTGTPSNDQLAVWTDSNTVEGTSNLTFSSSTLAVNGIVQVKEALSSVGSLYLGADAASIYLRPESYGSSSLQAVYDSAGQWNWSVYTATAVSSGASALSPNQGFQAGSQDTLAELCVDPSGNVVRGSQEATWTFTNAQLNALTNAKVTLLSAPGSGKIIVVEESNWLMESIVPGSGNFLSNLVCEIDGISTNAVATQMITARMTEIAATTFGGLGIYSRDVPELNRVYRSNSAMTIRAPGGTNSFPSSCISIALKIKYRVFDKNTF